MIRDVLQSVNLGHVTDAFSLDEVVAWDDVLSGGERQRLSFARLLVRPNVRFAVLDEATSALDSSNEDLAYMLLKERVPSFVSVGHHQSLERFHTHKLELGPLPEGASSGAVTSLAI